MSVAFVIVLYVLVAVVSVGSLPVADVVHARDYALAKAARPALGSAGFVMIGVAAMPSTASAINATLYGARISLGAVSVLAAMLALSFGIEAPFRRLSGRSQRA